MFFSVDVETGNLNPWSTDGYLLTIGAVVVADRGIRDRFYVRIDRTEDLDSWWWDNDGEAPHDTAFWWSEQNETAKNEAWLDPNLLRHDEGTAARALQEFVNDCRGDDEAHFVANPVSFDKMWIDQLFASTGVANPFHYRSLCLRSMKYGLRPHSFFGSDRENHEPEIPHHALHDAIAQGHDLIDMLVERDGGDVG